MEIDLEPHVRVRRDRFGKAHLDHGVIVFVVVIRLNEFQLRGEIPHPDDFEFLDVVGAVVLAFPFIELYVARAVPLAFTYPRSVRLEAIQIKMEWKAVERLPGQIVIGKCLSRVQRVRLGVVFGIDVVGHDALRQRLRRVDRAGRVRNYRTARLRPCSATEQKQQTQTGKFFSYDHP